jgi:hypothetical protein
MNITRIRRGMEIIEKGKRMAKCQRAAASG